MLAESTDRKKKSFFNSMKEMSSPLSLSGLYVSCYSLNLHLLAVQL